MTAYGGDSDYGTVFSYVIPEPGTSALLLAGMAGLGLLRRRSVRR
ncbi:MAG: PEP-CTERM sorting domain-containing protein [Verrucomicrobia bacterium]|nr:PEP-CTERM sorting domain-containing protein [Verrucomicrobiota bacterium]